jgi:hypothetical protein
MPPPFKQITREAIAALLERLDFKRRSNAVHMHHTWRTRARKAPCTMNHRSVRLQGIPRTSE